MDDTFLETYCYNIFSINLSLINAVQYLALRVPMSDKPCKAFRLSRKKIVEKVCIKSEYVIAKALEKST